MAIRDWLRGRARRSTATRGARVLAVLVACCSAPGVAATTYKWVDARGQVHYSDTPPAGVPYEVIAPPPPPPAPATPAPRSPEPSPTPAPLPPPAPLAETAPPPVRNDARCVDALYQIALLSEKRRAFKPGPGGTRVYLDDTDRPGELERLRGERDANCSEDEDTRRLQGLVAAQLMQTLSPDCQSAREKLMDMQDPSTRTPDSEIERQRAYVAEHCPGAERTDLWMADWMFTPRRRP